MTALLLRKALRDLRADPGAFASAAGLLLVSVMLAVALVSADADLQASIADTYRRLRFLDLQADLVPAPRSLVERVAAIPGVEAAIGRITVPIRFDMPQSALDTRPRVMLGRAISLPLDARPAVDDVLVTEGRYLGGSGEVLVERGFARAQGLAVGDPLQLVTGHARPHTIVGLVNSPEYVWVAEEGRDPRPVGRHFAIVFVSEADARNLGQFDGINEIQVRVADGARARVKAALEKQLGPWLARPPRTREEQPSHVRLEQDRLATAVLGLLFPALFLVLGTLVLGVATHQQVTRQQWYVGVLLAQGVLPRQVVLLGVGLAVLPALVGAASGALAGMTLGAWCTRWYADALGLAFVTTRPHLGVALLCAGIATAAAALAGWLASWRLAGSPPASLLRGVFSERVRTTRLDASIPILRNAPLLWRLPLRNALRHPLRSALSILAVAFSVMLALMAFSLVESQDAALDLFFQKVNRYDLYASLKAPMSPSLLPPVARWNGVERVELALRARVLITVGGRTREESVLGIGPDAQLVRAYGIHGEQLRVPPDGPLLAGPILLDRLHARQGDEARMQLALPGERPVDDRPGGSVWEERLSVGPPLFEPIDLQPRVPLARLQRLAARTLRVPADAVDVILVKAAPGAQDLVRRRLDNSAQVHYVIDLRQIQQDVRDLLRLADAWLALLTAFASLLALTLLSSATRMNVLERRRELALLAAQGVSERELAGLVVADTVLLWAVGLLFGLPAGWLTGSWILGHYQANIMRMPMALGMGTLAGTALISLSVCLLAAASALRTMRRRPLLEALAIE